jgi:hypothetical protein
VPVNGFFDKMIQDIIYDPLNGLITRASTSGFGHPFCLTQLLRTMADPSLPEITVPLKSASSARSFLGPAEFKLL